MAATTEASRGFGPGAVMRRLADGHSAGSFSNRNRARRFEPFELAVAELARETGRPVRILDSAIPTASAAPIAHIAFSIMCRARPPCVTGTSANANVATVSLPSRTSIAS